MIKTFPTVFARMALVFFSDSPRALPIKSDGFFITTAAESILRFIITAEKPHLPHYLAGQGQLKSSHIIEQQLFFLFQASL